MMKKMGMLIIVLVLVMQSFNCLKVEATNNQVEEFVEIIGLDQIEDQEMILSLIDFFEESKQLEVYNQIFLTSFNNVSQEGNISISDIQETCILFLAIAHEDLTLMESEASSTALRKSYNVSRITLEKLGFPMDKITNHQIHLNMPIVSVLTKVMRILMNLQDEGISPSVFVLEWQNNNFIFQKNTFSTYYQLGKSVLDIELFSDLGSQENISKALDIGTDLLNDQLPQSERIRLAQFLDRFGLIYKESATVGFAKMSNKFTHAIFKSCTQLW